MAKYNQTDIANRANEILGSNDISRYEEAFNVMKLESEPPDQEFMLMTSNEIKLWVMSDPAITTYCEGIAANKETSLQSAIAYDMLVGSSDLDLNNVKTQDATQAILTVHYTSFADWARNPDQLRWPGLKPGKVQTAMRFRDEGKI